VKSIPRKVFDMDKELTALPIESKIEKSMKVIRQAFEKFPHDKIVLAWTGGKDSTLILWLTMEVCRKNTFPVPKTVFINEGHVFEEMVDFVEKWSKEWEVTVDFVQNDDVLKQVNSVGDPVHVDRLSRRNQQELKRLGFEGEKFPFEPESYIGNHLMKTVALNMYLEKQEAEALITGIRWDEQEARADETYFSPRKDPDHARVHPILHFRERDVWEATHQLGIPYVRLYEAGYRSLGAKGTTEKPSDVPAWEQDLEHTTERVGRRQDKEKIMERLRKLGYM
jgi:phosphoadenosine phosphosulfate reductase